MANKPILYLHIGHPKSGSTTLQKFLYKNWQQIHQAGFAMPTASLKQADAKNPPGNPLLTLQKIKETQDTAPLVNWVQQATKTHDKLILSSEYLIQHGCHTLFKEIAPLVDIHLLYYVRRQDELLLSAWRQWGIKKGLSLTAFIDRRVEKQFPDYWSIVAPWRNKVGIADLRVRFIQPPFLTDNSLLADLCDFLGLDFSAMQPVQNENISLDARLLQFFSERTEFFKSEHDDSIFQLLQNASPTASRLRMSLTTPQFEAIRAAFEPRNQEFLKVFHPDKQGAAVIDAETAPIATSQTIITAEMAKQYVAERLAAIPENKDPRIIALRAECA